MRPLTICNRKSVGAARLDVLCTVAFYSLAVVAAIFVVAHFRDAGMEWLPSLLIGAGSGAIGVWFLSSLFWLIFMRITRGAPFCVGDHVEITGGRHQGAFGEVQEVLEGRYTVRMTLENRPDMENIAIFNWSELRRTPKNERSVGA